MFRGRRGFFSRTLILFIHFHLIKEGATRPNEIGGVGSALGLDLNSPSSVWGGAFKSFAGMQGVSYFANNTHLKIDAFMTPTHTPTPFETEIVKTREVNPAAGADASQYDAYGNIVINDGTGAAWDSGYGAGYKEKPAKNVSHKILGWITDRI